MRPPGRIRAPKPKAPILVPLGLMEGEMEAEGSGLINLLWGGKGREVGRDGGGAGSQLQSETNPPPQKKEPPKQNQHVSSCYRWYHYL